MIYLFIISVHSFTNYIKTRLINANKLLGNSCGYTVVGRGVESHTNKIDTPEITNDKARWSNMTVRTVMGRNGVLEFVSSTKSQLMLQIIWLRRFCFHYH